ncbi:MAG: phosphomannomutase [Fusobacteriaceae bacterium]|nr:phosphomannomutase [Fusobacteriaceae bacterium]
MLISIEELMKKSDVKFGTSGIRGLVKNMTDFVCYTYTIGFLKYLEDKNEIKKNKTKIAIAGDLRPSTDRIMTIVAKAVTDMNYIPLNCGKLPTPAITYYGIENNIPSIMVTGSHIPEDRNGIKFNKPDGEILKDDEQLILKLIVNIPDNLFIEEKYINLFDNSFSESSIQSHVENIYIKRYLDFFPENSFNEKSIGLYEHSSVTRDLMYKILSSLGAKVTKLGYSDIFIPIDTEAVREIDVKLIKNWILENEFDTIVSTDGDGDRPLISDENGKLLRGDISGILCAKYLQADSVSVSVNCNTAVEKGNFFKNVKKTKIGSPYIVKSILEEINKGFKTVVGYEANGGFFIGSEINSNNGILNPLPTRDAIISQLCILMLSREQKKSISQLVLELPQRFTLSSVIKNIQPEQSRKIINLFSKDDVKELSKITKEYFGNNFGKIIAFDRIDGIRIIFDDSQILHIRASGNAPEFRCYNEAANEKQAKELNNICLEVIRKIIY